MIKVGIILMRYSRSIKHHIQKKNKNKQALPVLVLEPK